MFHQSVPVAIRLYIGKQLVDLNAYSNGWLLYALIFDLATECTSGPITTA